MAGTNYVYIYGLIDPRSGAIRYVGKTVNMVARLAEHLRCNDEGPRSDWIRGLLADGLRPGCEILQIVENSLWEDCERGWIFYGREIGWPLFNISKGGNGGQPCTEEARQKLSDHFRGRIVSPETCQKISASKMGHPVSLETRQKLREANLGKTLSEEHKCNMRKSMLGRKITWGDKISAALVGIKRGPISKEHRIKIRGENNVNAVLTEKLVRELRSRYKLEQITVAALSEEYEINPTTAYDAIVGRSWRHVK